MTLKDRSLLVFDCGLLVLIWTIIIGGLGCIVLGLLKAS